MLPYLDHHNFVGARKALFLISISIIVFSKFEITSDELEFLGVTVRTANLDFRLISGLVLTYLLVNYVWRSLLDAQRRTAEFEEEFLRTLRQEVPFVNEPPSNQTLRNFLQGSIGSYDSELQRNIKEFRQSKAVKSAELVRLLQYLSIFFFDFLPPLFFSAWAYLTVFAL